MVPEVWNSHNSTKTFNIKKLLEFNTLFGPGHETCLNRSLSLPSNYTDLKGIQRICHVEGEGNKSIVVFGNSHSFLSFIGLAHYFKPIAKSITLIATPVCTPSLENKADRILTRVSCFKAIKFEIFVN
jgi:hypothetical protein